jgi:hypothetical protein
MLVLSSAMAIDLVVAALPAIVVFPAAVLLPGLRVAAVHPVLRRAED